MKKGQGFEGLKNENRASVSTTSSRGGRRFSYLGMSSIIAKSASSTWSKHQNRGLHFLHEMLSSMFAKVLHLSQFHLSALAAKQHRENPASERGSMTSEAAKSRKSQACAHPAHANDHQCTSMLAITNPITVASSHPYISPHD